MKNGNGHDTELLELGDPRLIRPQKLAASKYGMASTAHYAATQAAVWTLSEGGNAVDAAVSAAFALGVVEPAASGLGGQTMMIIHLGKTRRTFTLDGSSRAPHRAAPGVITKELCRRGYQATTVPATPAVLGYAQKKYGRLPLSVVLSPAIELAKSGYIISELQHALQKRELKHLKNFNAGAVFLKDGKRPYPPGAQFVQPALAQTLTRIAKKGVEDFYTGQIGRAIAQDMAKNGGLIRRDDLVQIPWPIERRPVSGHFFDWRVITMPPPGAGRTLIQILNLLQQFPTRRLALDTPEGARLFAEIIQHCLRDRHDRPFEPAFYAQTKVKKLLTEDYAKEVARAIKRRIKTKGDTTHLSVMDKEGNAVGLTQSIERVFGSCVLTESLGFLYNNYMMAFEHEDISHPYYLRPAAVPWASVAPSIVFRGRQPYVVLGSPGSERIVSAVAQVLLRLRQGKGPFEAVDGPRLHCSLAGKVSLEAARMRGDIPDALTRAGFEVDVRDPYSFYLGSVQMVMRDGAHLMGVADPRRDGSADGPVA